MEKGTLLVFKTKRGFAAKISYEKGSGKTGEIPVLSYKPENDDYNGTECSFERDGGRLVRLTAHDGMELVNELAPTPNVSSTTESSSRRKSNTSSHSGVSDSFSPKHTFLPKDTIEALSRLTTPDNFALKLNKAARHNPKSKGGFSFYSRERKGDNYEIRADYGNLDFGQIADRQLGNAKRLLSANRVQHVDLTIDWRLVQGLGIESVYETSLTLHPVYGSPYIPGSTLKGLIRSWIITEKFGQEEALAIQNEAFCTLFGCPEKLVVNSDKPKEKKKECFSFFKEARRGSLVFFDAFPLESPGLEVDVMNPHYAPYYSDKTANTPPADYHGPIPIHFITVAKTTFRFIVGSNDNESLNALIEENTVFQWLQSALTHHGIGAKTAVGYGYFKNP